MALKLSLLIIGFGFLIKGADFFVDGASSLAKRLKVSDLVIGLTVVGFGTSAPEFFVSVLASIQGNTDIAIGNVLGSNIFNILVILSISALIFPLLVTENTVWKEIPLSLLAAILVGILANDKLINGMAGYCGLTRIDGLVLVVFFLIFVYYIIETVKNQRAASGQILVKQRKLAVIILLIVVGFIFLIIGSNLAIKGAAALAVSLGVSQSLIALTIVAMGTSLPELATSAVAAHKGNADLAVGNIVGSNIFNIFFILGISAIVKPLPFTGSNNVDIWAAIIASFILFISMFTGKKKIFDRWEGVLCILLYAAYLLIVIRRG